MLRNKRKSVAVEIEPLVACLPGYENQTLPKGIYHRLTPKFYHKSGTELRLEQEQKTKLITWSN